jgi:O-antigen ligase
MKAFKKKHLLAYKDFGSKILFYLLILILPINLGLHFVGGEAFIGGKLIDYLVPTVYLQDLLVLALLLLNLRKVVKAFSQESKFLWWFLFALFLSTLNPVFFTISLSMFFRTLLYTLLMVYVKSTFNYEKDFLGVVKALALTILLLSLLAILQWRKQGAVFENYLFFGEQPYSLATPGINVENYFGVARVPPYGTFRHPNVFAGYLSIILILLLAFMRKNTFLKAVFILGTVTLFFTLSKFAWLSFLFAIIFWFLLKQRSKAVSWIIALFFCIFAFSFTLPLWRGISLINDHPSYYRRADLLESSYQLFKIKPLFGVGYGTSTAYIDHYLPPKNDIRFAQPPHNIFVLILVEAGIFAFISYLLFFTEKLRLAKAKPLLLLSLLQVLFLGSFDHYFFTMHQTHLLLWLILGFI